MRDVLKGKDFEHLILEIKESQSSNPPPLTAYPKDHQDAMKAGAKARTALIAELLPELEKLSPKAGVSVARLNEMLHDATLRHMPAKPLEQRYFATAAGSLHNKVHILALEEDKPEFAEFVRSQVEGIGNQAIQTGKTANVLIFHLLVAEDAKRQRQSKTPTNVTKFDEALAREVEKMLDIGFSLKVTQERGLKEGQPKFDTYFRREKQEMLQKLAADYGFEPGLANAIMNPGMRRG